MTLLWTTLLSLATAGTITDDAGRQVTADADTRLVVLGGGLTETVFALGAGDRVAGVDATSIYPEAVEALPKVGYYRQLSAEGLLSLGPELVIAPADAGPPAVLEQVRSAGVEVAVLPDEPSVDGAVRRIELLGTLLDRQQTAEDLVRELKGRLAGVPTPDDAPRVLFVYARGAGSVQVAGTETAADAMITLAGGTNAVDGWTGYKPLSSEGVIAARPDVILLTERGLQSLGGADALWSQPGMAATPAAQEKRVVALDDLLLLGFGPRTGEAVEALAGALSE